MAGKVCNANRLVQRVSVFVTEFVRKTYGFLTPDHVAELRSFRNEVEDNYPACAISSTLWKDDRKPPAHADTNSDYETELDTPIKSFTPQTKKRERESSSDVEEESQSIYKDYSSTETEAKKSVDSEWTGSPSDEGYDSDHNRPKQWKPRRAQVSFQLYTKIREMFYPSGPRQVYIEEKAGKNSYCQKGIGLGWEYCGGCTCL